MNTNLIHNVINAALTVIGGLQVMDWSILAPDQAVLVMSGLGLAKLVINAFRDGIGGLTKVQPPVQ